MIEISPGRKPDGAVLHKHYSSDGNKYAFLMAESNVFSNNFKAEYKKTYARFLADARRAISKGGKQGKAARNSLLPEELGEEVEEVEEARWAGEEQAIEDDGEPVRPLVKEAAVKAGSLLRCPHCRKSWTAETLDRHVANCFAVSSVFNQTLSIF
jgi:hypothetical protein